VVKQIKKIIIGGIILGLSMVMAVEVRAADKEYSIEEVRSEFKVERDGSMEVEEIRGYSFRGSFTYAYEEIRRSGERGEKYNLSNFEVCEDSYCYRKLSEEEIATADEIKPRNTYYVKESENSYYVKWFYRSESGYKNFHLKYRIDNAVTLHTDTAEIYWQIIGDRWTVAQNNIRAEFDLPKGIGDDQIKAWAHGPTRGRVSIPTNEKVVYDLDKLEEKTFFEARILLPKEIFSGGIKGTLSREIIEEEERRFIEETIRKMRMMEILGIILSLLSAGITMAAVIKFARQAVLFWRFSKDEGLPKISLSERWWEPPSDIDPAQVDQLVRERKELSVRAFTATILSLVQHRFYKLVRSEKKSGVLIKKYKYYLEREEAKSQPSGIERKMIDFLEKVGKDRIELAKIVDYCREHRNSSFLFFQSLAKTSLRENLEEGYFDNKANRMKKKISERTFLIIGMSFQIFVGLTIGVSLESPWFLLTAFSGVAVMLALAMMVKVFEIHGEKRTEKGREEAAKWKAFRRHLIEYRQTTKSPIDSIILWEKYLVYGTVLGVSMKTLSELPVKFNKEDERGFGYWGMTTSGPDGFGPNFAVFSRAMSSLSSVSTASFGATGVGSSGGASGGGGGEGGGGGGGAG